MLVHSVVRCLVNARTESSATLLNIAYCRVYAFRALLKSHYCNEVRLQPTFAHFKLTVTVTSDSMSVVQVQGHACLLTSMGVQF